MRIELEMLTSTPGHRWQHYGIPVLVLLLCLALTWLAHSYQTQQARYYAEQQFEFQTRELSQLISKRLQSHEQILLGGAALFMASQEVSRQEWQAYVNALRLGANYPGILALGYSQILDSQDLAKHQQQIQAEGFPDYRLRPEGPREHYSSILYIEPFNADNLQAFGYDMLSNPVRFQAMDLARRTGNPAMSGAVRLVQDQPHQNQTGFLIYVPVFRQPELQNRDWSNLQGFVYSAYRISDLLAGLLGKKPDTQPGFRLYDGQQPDSAQLMYTWGNPAELDLADRPRLRQTLSNQQHSWTIEFSAPATYNQQLNSGYGLLMLGGLSSLLLAGLAWSLGHQRERALKLAQQMTGKIRQNEQRLRDSEHQFRSLVANLPAAVYRYQLTPPCQLVYMSDGIEQLTGQPAASFIHQEIRQYRHCLLADDQPQYLDWSLATNPTGLALQQYRVLGPNGSLVWVEEHRQLQLGPDGQPAWLDGVIIDISQRKRVEQMKTEFVSTVSHELRTPLTSISGALGLLIGGVVGSLPESATRLLQIAEKNSRRLSTLINDLLDMEKISSGHMQFKLQACRAQELLQQALEANQSFADQYQVQLGLELPPDECWLYVDPERLQQILSNLLSNAIKYSPPQGRVTLALRLGNGVRIQVQDQGPGIPAEFRARIFEKFSQADSSDSRQKGGTGLGLAISRELASRMGGSLNFDSEPGQGCCFYLDFPCLPIAPISTTADNRLLIVEDDPDIGQLLQQMLESAGFSTELALTAAQAEQKLLTGAYEAMTLDLNLPDEHGLHLLQRLRKNPNIPPLPVVVVSAQQQQQGKAFLAGKLGILGWISKPFDQQQLLALLNKLPVSNPQPRVLQVEDDADLNQVVATLGQEFAQFDQANSLLQARQLLSRHEYELVILDLQLPDGSGMELLPELHQLRHQPNILILSSDDFDEHQQHLVTAALTKSRTSNEQLLLTLKRLIRRAS